VITIELDRLVCAWNAVALVQQWFSIDRAESEIAALDVHDNFKLSRLYTGCLRVSRKREWRSQARLLRVEHPWAWRGWG
jgi:hypothetical protein